MEQIVLFKITLLRNDQTSWLIHYIYILYERMVKLVNPSSFQVFKECGMAKLYIFTNFKLNNFCRYYFTVLIQNYSLFI